MANRAQIQLQMEIKMGKCGNGKMLEMGGGGSIAEQFISRKIVE